MKLVIRILIMISSADMFEWIRRIPRLEHAGNPAADKGYTQAEHAALCIRAQRPAI